MLSITKSRKTIYFIPPILFFLHICSFNFQNFSFELKFYFVHFLIYLRDEGKQIMENDEREKFIDLSCPRNNKSQSYYQHVLFDETSFIKMFLSLRFAIESR